MMGRGGSSQSLPPYIADTFTQQQLMLVAQQAVAAVIHNQQQMQMLQQGMPVQHPQFPLMQEQAFSQSTKLPTYGLPISGSSASLSHGRAMSMIAPSMSGGFSQQAPSVRFSTSGQVPLRSSMSYAPSIAPSERSTIGLAPRYRPVSNYHETASTLSDLPNPPEIGPQTAGAGRNHSITSRAVEKMKDFRKPKPSSQTVGDSSEDEGWLFMKKRKDRSRKLRVR